MRAGRTAWLPLALVALSCASLGSPKLPDTPDGTVRFVASGLAESRPQVLWQGLPPSWQADLTACLRESAEKTDPELFGLGWSLAGKVARILEEKQVFILDHPMLAAQIKDREKTQALLQAFAGMLRTVSESELADRDALRAIDVEEFLEGMGAKLLRQAMDMATLLQGMEEGLPAGARVPFSLDRLRVEDVAVVSQAGDAARLRIVLAGGESSEQDWVLVEGRWVPKAMADAWPKAIAGARRQLESAVPATPERKQAMIVQLRMVNGALDAVLATTTAVEFQAAASTAFGTLLGAAMAQAQAQGVFPDAPVPQAPPPAAISAGSETSPLDQFLRAHPIAVRDARRHVGASVHVVARDGAEFDGTLLAADGRTLTVERESAAGTMTHAMAVQDVKVLQIWR